MIAIKGNREERILDINKDEYLEMGFTILDDKLKVIASPSKEDKKFATAKDKIKELEEAVAEKDAKIKELEEAVKKNASK